MRWLAILILGVGLACSKPVVAPCPTPPQVVAPILRVSKLTTTAIPVEVFEAFVLDLEAEIAYSRQLSTILDGYR